MNPKCPIVLAVLGSCMAMAGQTAPRVSVTGHNAMPNNIVKPPAKWNFGAGSLWTHKDWQYAAYWDDLCQVSVARRKLPSGDWSVTSLPGYRRTATENRGKAGPKARGFGDGQEKVSMGISADGVIHLAFDHHCSTLHYLASNVGVANNPEAHEWSADLLWKLTRRAASMSWSAAKTANPHTSPEIPPPGNGAEALFQCLEV